MPENCEQKTVKSYTDETLAKCINAVENGKMSLRKPSKHFQACFIHFSFILQIALAISWSGRGASNQPASIFHSFVNLLMHFFIHFIYFSKLVFIFLGTLCNTSQQSQQNSPKKTWWEVSIVPGIGSLDCNISQKNEPSLNREKPRFSVF